MYDSNTSVTKRHRLASAGRLPRSSTLAAMACILADNEPDGSCVTGLNILTAADGMATDPPLVKLRLVVSTI